MSVLRRLWSVALPLVFVLGCAEEITQVANDKALVQAVFDPSNSLLPTPTDLIKNYTTGLLETPVDKYTGASKAFYEFLNTLDGYPLAGSAEVMFSGKLDKGTVSDKTILALAIDSTGKSTPVAGLTFAYSEFVGSTGATMSKVTITPAKGWARGTMYAFFVLGGANGVKSAEGKPVIRTTMFDIAAAENALCKWDATKGCTYNYNALLASAVEDGVRANPAYAEASEEELEAIIQAAVLSSATSFEKIRQGYDALLKAITAAGVKRDDVAVLWNFTTVSMTEILYDATTGQIPFPNNLLMDQTTGKVNLPAQPGETATEKSLREGLNTLDGFTTTGTYFAETVGSVDEASLASGVLVLDADAGLPATNLKIGYDSKAKALTFTPTSPLKEATNYAVVLFSKMKDTPSKAAASGLKDKDGNRFAASTFMALIRMKDKLVDSAGKSTLSSLDDATAGALEQARLAHKPLFDTLEQLNIKREDVVCAWTFKTQSFTETLTKLRAVPWSALAAGDSNQPSLYGVLDTTLTGWPTGFDKDNIGAQVIGGKFVSLNLIDEKGSGAFLTDSTKAAPAQINYTLTLPKGTAPSAGWPLIVFQHGLDKARSDVYYLVDDLAADGYATLAFDVIYHGDRSWCTEDAHCTVGKCDVATGQCTTGALKKDSDGIPEASGKRFLNVTNPFAIRDNFRQHVIDNAALVRAVVLGGATRGITDASMNPVGLKIDPTKLYFVSQSLGSILGTLVMSTESYLTRGVLSVPGSPVVDIILTSPNYKDIKTAVFTAFGITEGTVDYYQKILTFNWILDPADPGNFAQYLTQSQLVDQVASGQAGKTVYVPKKAAIIQLAEMDEVIPVNLGKNLASWAKIDISKTLYPNQKHGFLLEEGTVDPGATAAAREQALTFLYDGKTVCTPNVKTGQCN